jgi:hypothetical protein
MNYLKQASEGGVLLGKYHELEDVLKEATKNPEKQYSEEIGRVKEQLTSLLLQNDPSNLGYDAYRLFEIIDNHKVFGKPAADYIDGLLVSKKKDYRTIHAEINKKIKILTKQSTAINRFHEIFDEVILTDLLNVSIKDEITSGLYIYFEGQVAVRNINDLERFTRIWDGILQSFSELTGYDKQELEFGNLRNGFIVLGVITEGVTLEAFMKGAIGILNSLNLIQKIRKVQVEISPLPLSNNYFDMLEDEILGVINQSAAFVAEELVGNYFQGGRSDEHTVTENLCRSLKQILNFIEKGGKIECRPSEEMKGGDKLNKTLTDSLLSIKQSESIPENKTDELQIHEHLLAHSY